MARNVVLCEGSRGTLTQAYLQTYEIKAKQPQIYSLGVKELWRVKNKPPEAVIHTLGWPVPSSDFGGGFLYSMGEDLISLGIVVGLDYKDSKLDIHNLLQELKTHPLFSSYLKDGTLLEWGAKTIPEGGYHSLPPKLFGDGLLIAGDAAGFVNVPSLKGVHYAIESGRLAAQTIFDALKKKDYSRRSLASYDDRIRQSFIWSDLYEVRNMRNAFSSGVYWGVAKAFLMSLSNGILPGDQPLFHEDAMVPKYVDIGAVEQRKNLLLEKEMAVYFSGNKTRDDIPKHLLIGKDINKEVAEFYSHMCPANVYVKNGDELIINAPNCIDCKATDILGPRWTPREGGSGPNYSQM
jgi:electron-transferring-flavoprotein dehydrogenase